MSDFWNERFGTAEYAYGEAPNRFLADEIVKLKPGKILFPAEGEGRNAVYAAILAWDVTAFDISSEGQKKAELLATKHKVTIDYQIKGYEDINFSAESFDCIVLIYAHMPSVMRKATHKKLVSLLKPGGTLILEGFSKQQINNKTGGPKNLDFLFSAEELKKDFSSFTHVNNKEVDTELDEGPFHQGKASVVQFIGIK